ncbi:MAG TPA: dihydrofolate reductase [Polyangiaceae bacterium]|nr:dihydrofolate reductase [Polyangiaceae bacterium]
MRGIIYAVSADGVIGKAGTIPWHYPGDLKRFKRITTGCAVVMGRRTFESIGKALPGRRNIVVTSRPIDAPGIECVGSVDEALAVAGDADLWFIGGARVYAEAMKYADRIDVVYVPDRVGRGEVVLAPTIDDRIFEAGPLVVHEDDSRLKRRVYTRKR